MRAEAEARVRRLVEAARRIADPRDPLGVDARRVLPKSSGLSPQGVDLALAECLEWDPADEEIRALTKAVSSSARAHVLLSSNVFIAAHRAIALALACSPVVCVRPSRREPEMTHLLSRGAPGSFAVVDRLEPLSGEQVWAYGTDETTAAVARELPEGAVLHRHGAGIGIVVLDLEAGGDIDLLAAAAARDVVPFDQRGCVSPRVAFVLGSEGATLLYAERLAAHLLELERTIPCGRMDPGEIADVVRYRDTVRFAAELIDAGSGWVGVDVRGGAVVVPPVGRNVHVLRVTDLERTAKTLSNAVVAVAAAGPSDLVTRIAAIFHGARVTSPGRMQRPPFDGPVDRRGVPRVS